MTQFDLTIETLGELRYDSPLKVTQPPSSDEPFFKSDACRVRYDAYHDTSNPDPSDPSVAHPLSFESAGPRERIFFDAPGVTAAIVTCGGLCPGLNDVIRAIVLELYHWYGVRNILGIRYGYAGMVPGTPHEPIELTPRTVKDIHHTGGTLLGSSRGPQEPARMVDFLVERGVNMLFAIGGDGTLRGAHEIGDEAQRRGLPIAVVGVPKTIDNDIELVYRSFGLETAVAEATRVLECAHVEAQCSRRGIGLVKLMGRDSGFIAARAALASGDVNFCLVPEVPIMLEGENGLLAHLRRRMNERDHAVIAVAEGAGREWLGATGETDPSGNAVLRDIGDALKEAITDGFDAFGEPVKVRYLDPSYTIRSVRANSGDSIFCLDLGRMAVHAAMAGKTDMLVGIWHGLFTHVPLAAIAGRRKHIDLGADLWRGVIAATGQPWKWG